MDFRLFDSKVLPFPIWILKARRYRLCIQVSVVFFGLGKVQSISHGISGTWDGPMGDGSPKTS